MVTYSPWVWSADYKRHYCYSYDDYGRQLGCHWSGPSAEPSSGSDATPSVNPGDPRFVETPTDISQQPATSLQAESSTPQYEIAPTSQTQNLNLWSTAASTSGQHGATTAQQYNEQQYQQQVLEYKREQFRQQQLEQLQRTTRPAPAPLSRAVQESVGGDRRSRYVTTGGEGDTETLDPRFRRVAAYHHSVFYVPGRVFKMLWTEPAGITNPGKTRGSTAFTKVKFNEIAYSEIRRFVVIRNRGNFSQCIPIHTYNRRGATKPGLQVQDHGVIYTGDKAPALLEGEGITKQAIRVESSEGEQLEPESRINYGKPYAVEHYVKVLDIGVVTPDHQHLLKYYFDMAVTGYPE